MNLKEAFRYQNFLDKNLSKAYFELTNPEKALEIEKRHLRSVANSDAKDVVEKVDSELIAPNDDIVAFVYWLVLEKQKLSEAIFKAKSTLDFCLDAALETNKMRQNAADAVKKMLDFKGSVKMDKGKDYKFNAEGNQMAYCYDIEVTRKEAYNRNSTKSSYKNLISTSDEVSSQIDLAMVNSVVDYNPVFDVNDSFEDIMSEFSKNVKSYIDGMY